MAFSAPRLGFSGEKPANSGCDVHGATRSAATPLGTNHLEHYKADLARRPDVRGAGTSILPGEGVKLIDKD